MREISLELRRIAQLYEVQYLRSADISDSNMLTHYEQITGGLILYNGFSNPAYKFEGAAPVKTAEIEAYCLYRNQSKDNTAQDTDILLLFAERLAADIIYNFNTPYNDILEFKLEYVTINDSLLTGYRLTFEADLEGLVCTAAKAPPLIFGFVSYFEDSAGFVNMVGTTNTELFLAGDSIIFNSNDGTYVNISAEITSITGGEILTNSPFIAAAGNGNYYKDV